MCVYSQVGLDFFDGRPKPTVLFHILSRYPDRYKLAVSKTVSQILLTQQRNSIPSKTYTIQYEYTMNTIYLLCVCTIPNNLTRREGVIQGVVDFFLASALHDRPWRNFPCSNPATTPKNPT